MRTVLEYVMVLYIKLQLCCKIWDAYWQDSV